MDSSNSKYFNITQSSKLAEFLKKFDKSSLAKNVDRNLDDNQSNDNQSNDIQLNDNQLNDNQLNDNQLNDIQSNDNVLNNKKRKILIEDGSRNSFKQDKLIRDNQLNSFNQSNLSKQKKTKLILQDEENRSEKLRNSCLEKLMHSQFRNINQYLYENPTVQAIRYMTPELFKKYHESYSKLVEKWPVKPLDVIINEIKRLNAFKKRKLTIADLGCGEAILAKHFKDNGSNAMVHSFDLVDFNEFITKASIDNVPLNDNCCDIAVFCLSLMPTNIRDCIVESNRILKKNGLLYIAEVVSRFEENKFKVFINSMEQFGFQLKKQIILQPDDYFVLFRFKKTSSIEKLKGLPGIHLKPCKYKTR